MDILQQLIFNDTPFNAAFLINIVSTYENIGDYNKAIEFYENSLTIQQNLTQKNKADSTRVLTLLGINHEKINNNVKAFDYYERFVSVDHPYIAIKMILIGNLYYNLGDYQTAMTYFDKYSYMNNRTLKMNSMALIKIGNIYEELGDFKLALEYYEVS